MVITLHTGLPYTEEGKKLAVTVVGQEKVVLTGYRGKRPLSPLLKFSWARIIILTWILSGKLQLYPKEEFTLSNSSWSLRVHIYIRYENTNHTFSNTLLNNYFPKFKLYRFTIIASGSSSELLYSSISFNNSQSFGNSRGL